MQLTKEQIEFLNKVCYNRWTLNENGKVDVDGGVSMNNTKLTEIPVKFGRVGGWFHCANNNLTTLKNCPDWIYGQITFYKNPLTNYFKNIKEEDFPHWRKLHHSLVLGEYPFLINIIKKYMNEEILKFYLNEYPLTKLYYRD